MFLKTNEFCVKQWFDLLSNCGRNVITKRFMANAIPRGQDPEVVESMPVFQFTASDKLPKKKKNEIYCWGYSGGGALGKLGLVKRTKYRHTSSPPPPIEVRTAPMKSNFVDIQTKVLDISAGFGFTVCLGLGLIVSNI